MRRTLAEVAVAVGGRVVGNPEVTVTGATVNSKKVRPGDLFVAIVGQRIDAHDMAGEALAAGAAAVLASRDVGPPSVMVADTGLALRALGEDERDALDASVVGVTGSSGKTSVKDLTAQVLSKRFLVASSPFSFNTEIGVPLTFLQAPAGAEVIVCEMGSRGRGQIRLLCDIARPRIGIVTNVGPAHLEMFGSLDGVAAAKAELVEALPRQGTAILNVDDPRVRGFSERTEARVIGYGTATGADVRGEDVSLDAEARPSFILRHEGESEGVILPVRGEHMVSNALAAAAAGIALGVGVTACAEALSQARLSTGRMEVMETADGVRIVNDAYNANPASMTAALRTARWMAGRAGCVAVLGEMAELGERSLEEHDRIGEMVARLGIDRLVVVGERARRIASGALREGVEPDRVTMCDGWEEALEAVHRAARPGDVVLVKGSRVAGLERVTEALVQREGAA